MLQTGGLLADLTVAETVRLIASHFPRHRPTAEVIERAGITALARRRVSAQFSAADTDAPEATR